VLFFLGPELHVLGEIGRIIFGRLDRRYSGDCGLVLGKPYHRVRNPVLLRGGYIQHTVRSVMLHRGNKMIKNLEEGMILPHESAFRLDMGRSLCSHGRDRISRIFVGFAM
jgi:hypothetical protein